MKSTLRLLFFFFLMISAYLPAKAQLSFDWAISQGSKESDFTGSFRQDDQGHLYLMSTITDTADLDPGTGTTVLIPWFDEATVLSKWTTDGEYLWSSVFHTHGENFGAIVHVKDNQLLVFFHYTDSLIYIHQGNQSTLSVNPGGHVSIMTIDLDGNITSFRDIYDSIDIYFSFLGTDEAGQILAYGSFSEPLTFPTVNGDTTVVAQGDDDGFIMALNEDWEALWLQTFGSVGYDYVSNLHVANGKIYYALGHDETMIVNTINGPETFTANGEENGLFGTISLDGQVLTAQSFGGDLYDDIRSITADTDGNMYICGSFEGTVNFEGPGAPPIIYSSVNEDDGYVSKYSPDGFLQWTRIFNDSEYGGLHNIKLHRNEDLYLTGSYTGHTDLDPGPDSSIVETANWGDVYSVKFDKEGGMKWLYSYSGIELEGIREQIISPDGRYFIMGFHYGDFDADPSANEFIVPNYGGSDIFMVGLTEENVITSSQPLNPFEVALYPNPGINEVIINAKSEIKNVRIYARDGRYFNMPVSYEAGMASVQISSLPPGLYVAMVQTEDSFSGLKFIKQ